MGLHRFTPAGSGRMGIQQALATINGGVLVEYGCMGHMNYAGRDYKERAPGGCKIFSTHLNETDIALGNVARLWDAVDIIVEIEKPEVLFLTPSSVPEMIGADLEAEARELSAEYKDTKIISFDSGGFGASLCRGIENALDTLAASLPEDCCKTSDLTFNIIGSNIDLYNYSADAEEITRVMRGCFGAKPLCVFSSGTGISEIRLMSGAHVNLVIRREGIKAAERLKSRFGTPMVVGRPYGISATHSWIRDIESAVGSQANSEFLEKDSADTIRFLESSKNSLANVPELLIGAHTDVAGGIALFAEQELGLKVMAKWCDDPYCGTDETPYLPEQQRMELLKNDNYILLANSELIAYSGKNGVVVSVSSASGHGLARYTAPLIGLRGAANLARLISSPPPLPDAFETRGGKGYNHRHGGGRPDNRNETHPKHSGGRKGRGRGGHR